MIAQNGQVAHFRQSPQCIGKEFKEINIKGFGYQKELVRVYRILQKDLVDGSGVDMYLGSQPMVCLALTAQLVTDYLSYRYLHIAICFHAVLPIP